MSRHGNIIVEQGEDAGKQFAIPPEGGRVGRSSKNDITLVDAMLSRHHCRLFFKDDGLWITDLGSANETLLNGKAITESALHRGDQITIGDTVLKVDKDGRSNTIRGIASGASAVDLGFNGAKVPPSANRRIGLGPLLTIFSIVIALAAGGFILKTLNNRPPPPTPTPAKEPKTDLTLTVNYEKVEASKNNIFYYHFELTPNRMLSIAIDDLENNRSVRKEKQVAPDLVTGLAEFLRDAGFFDLDAEYSGVNPDVLEQRNIMITIGRDTQQVRITNRVEPDIFAMVREKLEHFGRVELGLWAIQFSTQKLLKMSEEAYLLGKKLYAERMVALGNLAAAIKSLNEAEWYLETVEENPDYYDDILTVRSTCETALEKRYDELNFEAERAIRLREWQSAASKLRVLLELIPSREDPRHQEVRKKLIEVEARLDALK